MILILLSYLRYQVDFDRMDVNSIDINAYGEVSLYLESFYMIMSTLNYNDLISTIK